MDEASATAQARSNTTSTRTKWRRTVPEDDIDMSIKLRQVKKYKRGNVVSKHDSEFVNVEVGMRELKKRMASSMSLRKPSSKSLRETKPVLTANAEEAIASKHTSVITPSSNNQVLVADTVASNGKGICPIKKIPVDTSDKNGAKPAKTGLDTARAEAMQSQKERIDARVLEIVRRRQSMKSAIPATPLKDKQASTISQQVPSTTSTSPRVPTIPPTPPGVSPQVPITTSTSPGVPPLQSTREEPLISDINEFISDDANEDLVFLQALEEVERQLMPPVTKNAELVEIAPQSTEVSQVKLSDGVLALHRSYEQLKRENEALRRANNLLVANCHIQESIDAPCMSESTVISDNNRDTQFLSSIPCHEQKQNNEMAITLKQIPQPDDESTDLDTEMANVSCSVMSGKSVNDPTNDVPVNEEILVTPYAGNDKEPASHSSTTPLGVSRRSLEISLEIPQEGKTSDVVTDRVSNLIASSSFVDDGKEVMSENITEAKPIDAEVQVGSVCTSNVVERLGYFSELSMSKEGTDIEGMDVDKDIEVDDDTSRESTIDMGHSLEYRHKHRRNRIEEEEEENTENEVMDAYPPSNDNDRASALTETIPHEEKYVEEATNTAYDAGGASSTLTIGKSHVSTQALTLSDPFEMNQDKVLSDEELLESEPEESIHSNPLEAALRAASKDVDTRRVRRAPNLTAARSSRSQPPASMSLELNRISRKRPAIPVAAKSKVKKPRSRVMNDKSTLLWPTLDFFYDFILNFSPQQGQTHQYMNNISNLAELEYRKTLMPKMYNSIEQYTDLQTEGIMEEVMASIRNAENLLAQPRRTETRLSLTSFSPCGTSTSSAIFETSGYSGSSSPGMDDYVLRFCDRHVKKGRKSPISDYTSGDLLSLRSPMCRDNMLTLYGVVLCDYDTTSYQEQTRRLGTSQLEHVTLTVLVRCPSASTSEWFITMLEMCLVNQRVDSWEWTMYPVHNLTTSAREYQAIRSIRFMTTDVTQMLVSGTLCDNHTTCVTTRSLDHSISNKLTNGLVKELELQYNKSQIQAILGSISDDSKISIIQGPPGTGKTKTILGLLSVLLDGGALSHTPATQSKARIRVGASLASFSSSLTTEKHTPSPIRILVAAPSNAAVDELIVRLLADGVYDARKQTYYCPRIVRVGRPESIHQQQRTSNGRNDDDLLLKKKWRKYAAGVDDILLENLVTKHRSGYPNVKVARQALIQNAQIVFCTLSGAGSVAMCEIPQHRFDALVVDEAAQAVEASVLIPFKFQPTRVVLVGDHQQLPACVLSKQLLKIGYERSLFQRLVENNSRVFLLEQQYRMHPEIAWFPSTYFYQGRLVQDETVEMRTTRKYHTESLFKPFVFYDVLTGNQSQVNGSTSLRNLTEIEFILRLLQRLVKSYPDMEWRQKIGIIAPYKQQIIEIRNALHRWENQVNKRLEVEVNTVDGFQGREKEIIIYSCVRTSAREKTQKKSEAFWADQRRMNVAITRAKSCLWIIGNSKLLQQSKAWQALINHAKATNRYRLDTNVT